MRRNPAFWLAAHLACALAAPAAHAEAQPPPRLTAFDASAYAPRLPLPDGWSASHIDDECQRWICRGWPPLRERSCWPSDEVFADWSSGIDGRQIGVSVSTLAPGWPAAVKALHKRFARAVGGAGVGRVCQGWRGPQGRVEECFGRFGRDELDADWSLERIEERPSWVLKIQAGGVGLPAGRALSAVRFTFFDGPLGPPRSVPKRRR